MVPAVCGAQTADARTIARRYFDEILNKGSAPAIDAIIAADVVFRNPPAVVKGIAVDLLGASPAALMRDVFPGSDHVLPMKGLIV